MKAQMKRGRVITGKLADTFTKIGLANEIKPKSKPIINESTEEKPVVKKPVAKKK